MQMKYIMTCRDKEELHPEPNYGFSFALEKVEEFDGFNDPREDDIYDFDLVDK